MKDDTINPDMTFEEALTQLEQLVRSLENGQLPLEDALKSFEKGVKLKTICEDKLKNAQLKIDQVMNKNGAYQVTPFDADNTKTESE
ncbi:MAG: exodeoxyribonuclease VII small subunit [Alphaproteobacteria bacterium]|nr:exodeoxyribonuclease VII small subunit [Alphaproteobacteria bacterium]